MPRVLIVDDDPAIVRLISALLLTERIDVGKAYSGEEALALMKDGFGEPNLIVLDLSMPGMGGEEFFRRVRKDGYAGPIVFCSANDAYAANEELHGQGAVAKPFDPDALLDLVKSNLPDGNDQA